MIDISYIICVFVPVNFFEKDNSRHANSPPPVSDLVPRELTLTGNDYTEDPGGYLEPTSMGANNSYIDIGDLPTMSNIEGSMVDSDFLLGKTSTPINIDKYKIGGNVSKENVYCSIHTLAEDYEEMDTEKQYTERETPVSPECRQNLINKIISNEHPSNNSIYKKQIVESSSSASSSGISGSQSSCDGTNDDKLSVFNKTTSTQLCLSTPDVSCVDSEGRGMTSGRSLPDLCPQYNTASDC